MRFRRTPCHQPITPRRHFSLALPLPPRHSHVAGVGSSADKLASRDCYSSLDDICKADFDALAISTQPWLHAPQCIQAMESGKDVYSAVPIVSLPDDMETLDWCDRLVQTVRSTGKNYMLGETTTATCGRSPPRARTASRTVTDGDGTNLLRVAAARADSKPGRAWQALRRRYLERGCLFGPMHYPTHSCCGPVCVMQAHALKVTAWGDPD